MAINTTPPTAHDYERTIHQCRQRIDQLEAAVDEVRAAANRWGADSTSCRVGCCCTATAQEIRNRLDEVE